MNARRQRAVKSLFRRTTKLEEVDQAKEWDRLATAQQCIEWQ